MKLNNQNYSHRLFFNSHYAPFDSYTIFHPGLTFSGFILLYSEFHYFNIHLDDEI